MPKLKIDLDEARRFLKCLSPENPIEVFQTFDDMEIISKDGSRKKRGRADLARILIGTLDQHAETLQNLNKQGAGIFDTVNQTDGKGRCRDNITAIRSYYIDQDGGSPPNHILIPTMIVKTARGFHYYLCAKIGASLDNFTLVQTGLIEYYNSDPAVKTPERVMRLPGFFHMKDPYNPHLVRIININDNRYSSSDLLAAYPPKHGYKPNRHEIETQTIQIPQVHKRPKLPLDKLFPIFNQCPAFYRIWQKIRAGIQLRHDEGFALFHLCLSFNGGVEWFLKKVPGWGKTDADKNQLKHSINRGYEPWTCRKLQEKNICGFNLENHCLSRKPSANGYWLSPNPIRFAFGAINNAVIIRDLIG